MRHCFVISPIGEEGSEIRKHADGVFKYIIEPAMQECSIEAFRSDQLDKPGRISEQMFRAIFESDLCLAVLTRFNPNVFYELAIAHSARRPVIILIEKGQALPFDIHDLRCVHYDLEIDSFMERVHINHIVNYVREFEAAGWEMPDLFGAYRSPGAPNLEGLVVFEESGAYNGRDWQKLLQDTQEGFDILGTALMGWRKSPGFREVALQKARQGCQVRILLWHPENPALPFVSADLEMQVNNIKHNLAYFESMAQECENIKVRQIRQRMAYFFLTRSDRYAVIVQHLASQKWGNGPLFQCDRENKLYEVYRKEFEELWETAGE